VAASKTGIALYVGIHPFHRTEKVGWFVGRPRAGRSRVLWETDPRGIWQTKAQPICAMNMRGRSYPDAGNGLAAGLWSSFRGCERHFTPKLNLNLNVYNVTNQRHEPASLNSLPPTRGLAGRLLGLVASKCLASLRSAPLGGGGYFMSHRFGGDRHSMRPFLAFRTHHFRVALHRFAEGFGMC
jgi:hypothetical protein